MGKAELEKAIDKLKQYNMRFSILFLLTLTSIACTSIERLQVSSENPHLIETIGGKPVFVNNYTAWRLLVNGSREDISELIKITSSQKFNMISCVILNADTTRSSIYGTSPLAFDSSGNPDPLKPNTTPGADPEIAGQYDYWDHVDYLVDYAAKIGMYVSLHPTWGDWVSGSWYGPVPKDTIIFNESNAYAYGQWLGRRYGSRNNLIWMIGGDRSAVYDLDDGIHDFREVWSSMAKGLRDGENALYNKDKLAEYDHILISFHPRKYLPNSSEWFHSDPWLAFNSVQDAPYDQIVSIPHDYELSPKKPTWLFEGRYEGRMSAWGVRYQAYQTVFAGGFGHTYGSENWHFPPNWKELTMLPGSNQMAYLYAVSREIWSDQEYLDRMPDQAMISGENGFTYGDGEFDAKGNKKEAPVFSDRITAIRSMNGNWAMAYSANGRDITLDLSHLAHGKLNAYWFNPRNGKWWLKGNELDKITPFLKDVVTGKGEKTFNPPGDESDANDWVLVLK
ncbi:MAG: glycoside hydrolase family 140 protein [Bacteroidota bacterium]